MADEGLALLCASIGRVQQDDHGHELYVKSSDCLEHVKDLQRYLRRDNPQTRQVFLQLGKWNIVRQDLVPLIRRYGDDFELLLNCVKVLAFLTMPVDPSSHQVAQQIEYLQLFKAAIVDGGAVAPIVALLEEPRRHLESECPKDDDWKMFQLFLTLLRNFLSFPACLPASNGSSPSQVDLRDSMLGSVFSAGAMDLVLALTPHVARHGALRQDNLLVLETVQQLVSGQRADLVATAVDQRGKRPKQSDESGSMLRTFFRSEKEQRKQQKQGDTTFSAMFVQVAQDGSKSIWTKNPHHTPLENLARKPQIKRGCIKRIAPDPQPFLPASDNRIYVLLKNFADRLLSGGYNIMMQSVKDDIRRERSGLDDGDIVAFFRVAQFFTAYQCALWQSDQRNSDGNKGDEAEGGVSDQRPLCGPIASTMDDEMFNIVILKWQDSASSAETTKEWGPAVAAGGTVKEMIRMVDMTLRARAPCEESQELRTARALRYKILHDQTENGVLHLLNSLIKSFDIYKQSRSHLADLVETTHIVFRIVEGFEEAGESLRVLTKVRGGRKKMSKPDSAPSEKLRTQDPEGNGPEGPSTGKDETPSTIDATREPSGHNESADQSAIREVSGHNEFTDQSAAIGDARAVENGIARESEGEDLHTPPVGDDDGKCAIATSLRKEDENEEREDGHSVDDEDGSDAGDQPSGTREVTFDVHRAVAKFASNTVVRNYCWLLKSHSKNRAAINHYIVRMLQRICDDCVLEPMLYQVSLLQTFYGVLSDREMQGAEDQRFVVSFLTKFVSRLVQKLESNPILFVDMLFWKTKLECHDITADYMLHSLRKEKADLAQPARKKINIADALGDDEEEAIPAFNAPESDNGGSGECRGDDAEAPDESSVFSEAQEAQMRDLFERYKADDGKGALIARELDSSRRYTEAQVLSKLKSLGLLDANHSTERGAGGQSLHTEGVANVTRKRTSAKSRLFSDTHDRELRELFTRYGGGKNVTRVITEHVQGEFTSAQVSRRLRTLGLIKANPRSALPSLHPDLTDDDLNRPLKTGADRPADQEVARADRTGSNHTRKRRKNAVDSEIDDDMPLSRVAPKRRQKVDFGRPNSTKSGPDSDDDMPLSSLALKRRQTVDFGRANSKESGPDSDGHELSPREMEDFGTNSDERHAASPTSSRRLRRMVSAYSEPTALSPGHADLAEDDGDFLPRIITDIFEEEAAETSEEKLPRKRRINTLSLSDTESDVSGSGLPREGRHPVPKWDDDNSLSRRAHLRDLEFDSEDEI